jgi:hypothetical protein
MTNAAQDSNVVKGKVKKYEFYRTTGHEGPEWGRGGGVDVDHYSLFNLGARWGSVVRPYIKPSSLEAQQAKVITRRKTSSVSC